DQLLLRQADAKLWSASAHSLQYLVLDEFHTYDGAQGTDVAMLLRRLGLALKSGWPTTPEGLAEAGITENDLARPLGTVTPVATSATLGDGGDPTAMRGFAETVFGVPFTEDAVVTESRLSLAEWIGSARDAAIHRGRAPIRIDRTVGDKLGDALGGWDDDELLGARHRSTEAVTRTDLAHLYRERPPTAA